MAKIPAPGKSRFLKVLDALLTVCFALLFIALLAEGIFRCVLLARAAGRGAAAEFELYASGESTMRGIPFGKAPPDVVSELFAGALAGRPIRVINLAEGGKSVYPQTIKAVRALKYRNKETPAALLIYAGHNEQIGAGKDYPLYMRLYEAFKQRALIRSLALSELVLRAEQYFSVLGVRDQAHYEFYLRTMIETAKDAGVVPVISTLAGNISGAEPGGADASPELAAGVALELKGNYAGALESYNSLLAGLYPGSGTYLRPYLEYRLGRCFQALGKTEAARKHLLAALETDPLQLRAKPSQNALIRALALEYDIGLVDAEKLLAEHSPGGLPGADMFVDLMHPDAPGYLLLSRAFAEKLEAPFRDQLRRDIRDPSVFFTPPFSADRREMSRTEAYTQAATFLLLFAKDTAPMPDRLKLAEKDFKKSLEASPENNLAQVGLRVAGLYQKNGNSPLPEVKEWLDGKRPNFEYLRQFTAREMQEADAFLRRWEGGIQDH